MIKLIQSELKRKLRYDQETGIFTWIDPGKYHKEKTGKRAGCFCNNKGKKYEHIRINKSYYGSHRLAWLYVYGYFPKIIDHINGDSMNNRILNLREVNEFQNTQNHKTGVKKNGLPTGVTTNKKGYRSRITVNKKVIALGVYKNPRDAQIAYETARKKYHDAPCMEMEWT